MERLVRAFSDLADAVKGLSQELRRGEEAVSKGTPLPRPPQRLRAAPVAPRRVQRVSPYPSWPSWGTEHVMLCTKQGCVTCARLARTRGSLGGSLHDSRGVAALSSGTPGLGRLAGVAAEEEHDGGDADR